MASKSADSAKVRGDAGLGAASKNPARLLVEAQALSRSGMYREAIQIAQAALQVLEVRPHTHASQTRALALIAKNQMRLGEYELAITACQSAVEMHEHAAEDDLIDALLTQIKACSELGLHDEALRVVDECLTVAQRSENPEKLSWALNRAGCANDAMGNHAAGQEFLQQALELARLSQSGEALFAALNNYQENVGFRALARFRKEQIIPGDAACDLTLSNECVELAYALENDLCVGLARANRAMMLALLQRFEEALDEIDMALELATPRYPPLVCQAGQYRGQILLLAGRLDEAVIQLQQTLKAAYKGKDRTVALALMRELGQAFKQVGDHKRALEQFEAFYEVERKRYLEAAELRSRMVTDRMELERARLEAERASLTAELLKLRSDRLAEEKEALEVRTAELSLHANQDALTGLWNRRYFDARLPQAFHGCRQHGQTFSLALIDLDHFKRINDLYGHDGGDHVLRTLANTLKHLCRPTDLLARLGGEEFVLLMPNTSEGVAVRVCERLRQGIRQLTWDDLDAKLRVTTSIGVCGDDQIDDPNDLLREADRRLYQAKDSGRDVVVPASA